MKNLTIGTISENELLELAETIKLKSKLIAERKTIASNVKEKGRASCFISFFAHGFSRDLCEEQGDGTVGQLLQSASNKESEFILDRVYDSAISDLEIVISNYTVEQNSLIERKELTGSDLCRAMLARGDTYIKCFCHNDAELSHFSNYERPYLITKYWENGCFSASDSCCYKYAVPINNQGEPLTATDVGL